MARKICRTGNSLVVSLPLGTLEALGLAVGSEGSLAVDRAHHQIIITAAEADVPGVDTEFARQVAELIERNRPALKALACQ
jgi:antitoxin component of MazEF toxin-antitoxin module